MQHPNQRDKPYHRGKQGAPTILLATIALVSLAAAAVAPSAVAATNKAAPTKKKTTATTATAATTAPPPTAAATTAVPAPTGAAVQDPKAAPLILAVNTEPSTLDAQLVNDRSSRVVGDSIFETLLGRDRNNKPSPLLADTWEANSSTSWRFSLHKGISFTDGEPMNADAVVFSINRILDPKFGTQRTSYLEAMVRAVKVDDMTVDIITSVPSATLPIQITSIPIVPPNAAAKIGTNPIGTGPYVFVKWDRGREIVAKRNETYWGPVKPKIAEFHLKFIADAQTALAALQTGEVDLVVDLLAEQKKLAPKVSSTPSSEFSYIAFNTYKKELNDPRVRLALNYAVDKELLASTIYGGDARPDDAQHLTKDMLGYNPDLHPYPYDVEKAKSLMKAAGYENGFTLDLNVPIGRYSKGEESSDFIAAQLAKINIKVNVVRIDFNTFRVQSRIKGTATGAMDLKYSWNSNEFFDGSRIIAHITCDGTSSKYCNPQVDKLMDEATKTQNQFDRGLKYRLVWKLLNDDPYSIMLLQQNLIYGMTKRLQWQPGVNDDIDISNMITTK